ncbi:hypothetical protein RY831_29515 [Noviherbaspirillum sp. CPCC 100848]|uniref:DUF6946 domain-containing protein n=1 Tax=Noviherbaspirillum album TaxID=3080276 RepID=A0ABU6JIE9_9BURK|nr:hypothetical protein [Noviherbaspirillum sp. CPCC 100848]MEC4723300.1 hypothetical protein [Noviherbaspirillum sp. CPCC 100848]
MSAAACWEESEPLLPSEVTALLESSADPALVALELLVAMPEWEVKLPGGDTVSQTDVLAIARNRHGLVVLGVEAKVDEPFGPTLKEKKAGASQGQLDRIAYLEKELGRQSGFSEEIRYQLLHRSVSALLTARAFHASVAVMLIHSFSPVSRWRNDFDSFCAALDCTNISQDLLEVPGTEGPRLLLGWCTGDTKFLDVELPSAY